MLVHSENIMTETILCLVYLVYWQNHEAGVVYSYKSIYIYIIKFKYTNITKKNVSNTTNIS